MEGTTRTSPPHVGSGSTVSQCCSPRGKSLSSRILADQFTSPCPWTTKSLKIFKDFAFCKLSVIYDHVASINSITATVHEDTVKNVLLSDVTDTLYMSVSKPFFIVSQCCCPRGKSLSLSWRTNLQLLVLVLGPQVLDLVLDLVLEPYVLEYKTSVSSSAVSGRISGRLLPTYLRIYVLTYLFTYLLTN